MMKRFSAMLLPCVLLASSVSAAMLTAGCSCAGPKKENAVLTPEQSKNPQIPGQMIRPAPDRRQSVFAPEKMLGKDFYFVLGAAPYSPPADPAAKAKYDAKLSNELHYPLEKLPPDMRKYLDIPAFRENLLYFVGYNDHSSIIKNPDGTLTFDLDVISRMFPPPGQPFYFSIKRFTRPYKKGYLDYFYRAQFRHPDREKYLKWKAAHPDLVMVHSPSEWGNEANILPHRLKKYLAAAKLPPEEEKAIRAKWVNTFADRREYVENRLHRLFDRHCSTWFDDGSALYTLEGMWCVNHLAAYWGDVRLLVHETSRNFAMWQVQLMFNRGAARQFGKPWGWYVASYLSGYSSGGKEGTTERACWKINPNWLPGGGLSLNAIERTYRMAWLSGATILSREDTESNFWDRTAKGPDRWKPMPEAQAFIRFSDFIRANPDRGATCTPVALLVPYDQGACRSIWPAFAKFPYLKADNMYHGFIATIFRQFDQKPASRMGKEITLRNSPYGDIFDVLTPDFPDSSALRKSLGAYRAAVLIGGYEKHPAMAQALREYVTNGGTLILNSVQLNNFDSAFTGVKVTGETVREDGYVLDKLELDGAKPLLSLPDGTPVFTAHDFGRGRVIVSSPRWLVQDFPDASQEATAVMYATRNGARQYKYIRALLAKLTDELLPVKVSGDIQYGLNKTKDGWLLYLFNNNGVTKFTDKDETFDPSKTAAVSIRLKDIKADRAYDICSKETFPVRDGVLELQVKPGGWRMLKINAQK
ncbi:MAG: hypothetical protein IJS14_13915 [Lentisphaeria bacterium]|nr:hypothetical protein [Lentisphaeria bacterium]